MRSFSGEYFRERIWAVVVTFGRDDLLKELIHNFSEQTLRPSKVLIIDNGNSKLSFEDKGDFVILKRLPRNLGSAGGYYFGISLASRFADFVFTSDDDTLYEKDSIEKLYDAFFELSESFNVGAVRCAWENFEGERFYEVFSSVWTGVLISSRVFNVVGFPKREFFLYADDDEFFRRMTKSGFKFFMVKDAKYKRRPQEHKIKRKLFGRYISFYEDDFRNYYSLRNEVFLAFHIDHSRIPKVVRRTTLMLFYLSDKRSVILEALFHGLFGILGENKKYSPASEKS